MVIPAICINLFFVPAIALWVHYKRHNVKLASSINLLLQYAIFCSCNVPLTKVGIFLFKKILHQDIPIDSGYYTLLAIMAAALLPGLIDWGREIYAQRKMLLRKGIMFLTKREMKYRQKLLISFFLVSVIVIAYLILGPLEIFAGNVKDFQFKLGDFIGPLLAVSVLALISLSCLLSMLPDHLYRLATGLLLWFGGASYMQYLFMNRQLTDFHGGPMDWESLSGYTNFNLIVWLLLLIACMIACCRIRKWFSFAKLLSICLCIIQMLAVVFVFITMHSPEFTKDNDLNISGEKEFTLSANENIVVFILDAFGSVPFENMLIKYPEVRDIMRDFTYYDNADCHYYDTFPSVSHMLTGYEVEFGGNANDWLSGAWSSSQANHFFQTLHDEHYECNIFMPASDYVFGDTDNLYGKFDNVLPMPMNVDTPSILEKILRLSVYRCVPYVIKPEFEVLTYEFADVCSPIDVEGPIDVNSEYYQALCANGLSLREGEDRAFIVKHLFGLHAPCTTDAQANEVEEERVPVHHNETGRGLFKILQEYLDQMKQLGVYDNANIIIMADHASWANETDVQPIFFIKQSKESNDQMKINSAPISWDDFQATILTLAGCNDGSFGTSIFDWKTGQRRDRTVYRPHNNEQFGRWMFDVFTYSTDRKELQQTVLDGPDGYEEYLIW